MNKNLVTVLLTIVLGFMSPKRSYSQGTFENLDFEFARIILDTTSPYPGTVHETNAVPGWTVIGGYSPYVLYDDITLSTPAVSIHDLNDPGQPAIQGRYSVYLQSFGGTIGIAQTGQIPVDAESLTFWSYFTGFQLSFNGQPIPYASIGSGPNYTIYAGDISSFAGITGELRFSGGGFLDNIQFSSQGVPEPCVSALFALGALLLGRRVVRRRR